MAMDYGPVRAHTKPVPGRQHPDYKKMMEPVPQTAAVLAGYAACVASFNFNIRCSCRAWLCAPCGPNARHGERGASIMLAESMLGETMEMNLYDIPTFDDLE